MHYKEPKHCNLSVPDVNKEIRGGEKQAVPPKWTVLSKVRTERQAQAGPFRRGFNAKVKTGTRMY